MTEPILCPIGMYCPANSETYTPCPVGTYNPVLGGTSLLTHCLPCAPGRYCASKGLSAPTGDCNAGYFCESSAETNKPAALDEISGRWGKCPPGSYCPAATAYPYPCPAGTFSDSESLTSASACTTCTAGHYCETRGLTQVTGQCDEGFYCPVETTADANGVIKGAINPRNDAYKCTKGNYCPTGSTAEIPCAAGTYANEEYQEICISCPKGYYCPLGAITPTICPAGSFCLQNSGNH